eukprot:727648-Pyramimonas_sp.AAC.2
MWARPRRSAGTPPVCSPAGPQARYPVGGSYSWTYSLCPVPPPPAAGLRSKMLGSRGPERAGPDTEHVSTFVPCGCDSTLC